MRDINWFKSRIKGQGQESKPQPESKAERSEDINYKTKAMEVNEGDMSKEVTRRIITVVFVCILFYLFMKNLGEILGYGVQVINVFTPFILGACLAFVINVPMSRIEALLFGKIPPQPDGRISKVLLKIKRPVSFIITMVIVVGVLALVIVGIVPQLAETFQSLAKIIPGAIDELQVWIDTNIRHFNAAKHFMDKLSVNWEQLGHEASITLQNWAKTLIDTSFNTVANILNGILYMVIGLVFSAYILMQKEKLGRQGKQVIYGIWKEKRGDKLLYVINLTGETFKNFVSGQCLDALINGVVFFIVLTITGMPYPLMTSVIIGFMALIPIIGSFIGCGVGILLVLMVAPHKLFYFLIIYIVIQQLDGNVIYPNIVGNTVGLPSIWVLMAVTVGGSAMGVIGMIVFIPIGSVLYQLIRHYTCRRLEANNIAPEKWEEPLKLTSKVLDK